MKKILIIDDSPTIVEFIAYRLAKSNYDVLTAENGKDGILKVKAEKPNLILLDMYMPQMSGIEVCKELKSNQETKNIPIIFLTGDENFNLEKAKELGADGFVTKPYEAKFLLDQIRKLLKL